MVKIIVNNLQDITKVQVKLRALKVLLPRLQEVATERASEDILDEIHAKMKINNFSDKIINATSLGRTERIGNFLRQHFISDYVSETGFEVSEGREEGTETHTVRPQKPDGILRWVGNNGQIIFRKFARPKGIERLLIIEKTLASNKEKFKNKIADNLAQSIQRVLGV